MNTLVSWLDVFLRILKADRRSRVVVADRTADSLGNRLKSWFDASMLPLRADQEARDMEARRVGNGLCGDCGVPAEWMAKCTDCLDQTQW